MYAFLDSDLTFGDAFGGGGGGGALGGGGAFGGGIFAGGGDCGSDVDGRGTGRKKDATLGCFAASAAAAADLRWLSSFVKRP